MCSLRGQRLAAFAILRLYIASSLFKSIELVCYLHLIMNGYFFNIALLITAACAWMPQDRNLESFTRTRSLGLKRAHALPNSKIRGVNLGGWLISEPWMMGTEWSNMGCKGQRSEFDCVSALGQSKADDVFNAHYAQWITPAMIQDIYNAGLNTIRIPIGYWSLRSIVDSGEHFPNMDLQYLDAVIQKAADLNMFVVIDLHGAPGAQKVGDPFTGRVSIHYTYQSMVLIFLRFLNSRICQASSRKPTMTAHRNGLTG